MNKQRTLFFVFGLVTGLILGAAGMAIYQNSKPEVSEPSTTQVSLEGKLVCLPHKNTDGPQTLECASGLRTNDDKYYALKGSLGEFGSGDDQAVIVEGTLEGNETDKYKSEGTVILGTIKAAN